MEKIHCNHCDQPTFHQTKNVYGNQIHKQGIKCLCCGQYSGETDNIIRLPQKAMWRIERDEVIRWL